MGVVGGAVAGESGSDEVEGVLPVFEHLGCPGAGSVSLKMRAEVSFTMNELLSIAGILHLSLSELLGDSLLLSRVPAPEYLEDEKGKKKVAPIGFIPTGTTYEMVASAEPELAGVGPAGLEPATKGLQDPIFGQVLKTTFFLKKLYTTGALKDEA